MKLHYLDLQAGRLEGFNGFLPSRPRTLGDFSRTGAEVVSTLHLEAR